MTAAALNYVAVEPCVVTCGATLGLCYYPTNLNRRDITESATANKVGLPARVGFRIVNADTCEPVPNAAIDIWHTGNNGIYSAPISTFCNGTDTETVRTQFFGRGIQTTDANGWAYFDSFSTGWYSGRVTHIHATIRVNNTAMVMMQFFFAAAVAEYIYRTHPNYSLRIRHARLKRLRRRRQNRHRCLARIKRHFLHSQKHGRQPARNRLGLLNRPADCGLRYSLIKK